MHPTTTATMAINPPSSRIKNNSLKKLFGFIFYACITLYLYKTPLFFWL
jgi:hypothetical protein